MTQSSGPPDGDRFLERMDAALAGWDEPAERLAQALERDELELYAQPILALRAPGDFPIAEVLVRLREEEEALLPPGEFLPVFEHCGMMPQLDRWVARRAVARLARGSRIARLSINVSAQTLGEAEFASEIAGELARAGLPSESIIVEIDESDALLRPESAARFAASAKSAGCRVLIDGFGRRAVSFAMLKSLQADYIKVDGVIVRKLPTSEIARNKLNAVVRVGDVIGVGVIGECVEDPEVLERLRAAGAGYAQGFGVRRPAPIDEVIGG
jgi:EAL domain-containing protein (putative c-di-GMP-specific phosphodiesterase class I)